MLVAATTERLAAGAGDAGAILAALGELEARGLVRRLSGGRYIACVSPGDRPASRPE